MELSCVVSKIKSEIAGGEAGREQEEGGGEARGYYDTSIK